MSGTILPGQRSWSMTRDAEGHREYKLKNRIRCDQLDGPAQALQTPGLPTPGSWWLVDNDVDLWAWCRPDATVTPVVEGEPNTYFDVEQTFSTKPPPKEQRRCTDNPVEDPLLEPPKINGTGSKYHEEATKDRFGQPITNSAHEQVRGHQNEWDANRDGVKIEMNVATFAQVALAISMRDTLNAFPLWGFNARCIKLSSIPWERKFQGACQSYFSLTLDFEIRDDTFDRDLLDEGTKVLNGHWGSDGSWVLDNINGAPPDHRNPSHFKRAVDRQGNQMRVILDGKGRPADVAIGVGTGTFTGLEPGQIHVEKYQQSDFLLLGIPTSW